MNAENTVRLAIRDHFDESPVCLRHIASGITLRRIRNRETSDVDRIAFLQRLSLRQADMRNLRIRENGRRDKIVSRTTPSGVLFTLKKIVSNDICLMIGFMPQLLHPVRIAERPDPFLCRFQKLIRANPAAFI